MTDTVKVLSDDERKCFACDRKLGGSPQLVDTRDDQHVFVGAECFGLIVAAGNKGYQPPKGGPRLYLLASLELRDDQLHAIETREPWPRARPGASLVVGLTVAERDSLCQTVRALRQQVDEWESHRAGIIEAVQTAEARVDELESTNTALREQLGQQREEIKYAAALAEKKASDEQRQIQRASQYKRERDELQLQLAQVTAERDRLRESNDAIIADNRTVLNNFRSAVAAEANGFRVRTINVCKERAAQWEQLKVTGHTRYLSNKVEAANEIITALEQLQ